MNKYTLSLPDDEIGFYVVIIVMLCAIYFFPNPILLGAFVFVWVYQIFREIFFRKGLKKRIEEAR